MDSAGHFLFVANQGLQSDPTSGTISVFSIQDTTLTEVPGSPFRRGRASRAQRDRPSVGSGHARRKILIRRQPVRRHGHQILGGCHFRER